MIDEKVVKEIAFRECNDWVTNAPTWEFTEVRLLKFAKSLLEANPRVPVAWQIRTDLSGPYSSVQGWQAWENCDEFTYRDTLFYIERGYKVYQARELFAD